MKLNIKLKLRMFFKSLAFYYIKVLVLIILVALLFLITLIESSIKPLDYSITHIAIYIYISLMILIQLPLDIRKIFELWKRKRLRRRAIRRNLSLNKHREIDSEKNNCAPYYSIEKVHFEGYKGICEIDLDITPGASWVFLTGENGYGKTVFLQALAISLYGKDENSFRYIEDNNCKFEVTVVSPESNRIYNPKMSTDNFGFVTCYGINRISVYSKDSSNKEDSPLDGLFKSDTLLRNIEARMINWHGSNIEDDILGKRCEAVKKCLMKILNLSQIRIERGKHENQVFYYEKDSEGNKQPRSTSDELASGYRAIIGMVGDIFIKFYEALGDNSTIHPRDFKGIVIIDEFELHFHPKWQKKLPGILSSVFPQLQFIVSTHSPVPMLGSPDKSIFLKLYRSNEGGIDVVRLKKLEKEIKYLLPNTILTSDIFDMDEIEAVTNDDFDKIHLENKYSNIQDNLRIDEKLNKYLKDKEIFPGDLFKD